MRWCKKRKEKKRKVELKSRTHHLSNVQTIQLGFKMQATDSVWRDKPHRLKGLNFTLKIEHEHFKWAGTLGILLRFRRAGKTFKIKSANNAVQRSVPYLLQFGLSLGLRNINSQPSFKHACSFPQNTISDGKGSLMTFWKREFNFNIHHTVQTSNIIQCVWMLFVTFYTI